MANGDSRKKRIEEQLAELALGILDPTERPAVEAAIAESPVLAAELEGLRRAISDLDDLLEPAVPGAALRDRVLASADPARRFEGFAARMARLFDFSIERARTILAAIGDPDADWEAPGIPGVRLYHFAGGPAVAGADCGLVEVAPGVEFLPHTHHGEEISLNLQGRAIESTGQEFVPGDVVVRPEGSHHSFRSTGDEAYVFAVVLYGGFHLDEAPDRID